MSEPFDPTAADEDHGAREAPPRGKSPRHYAMDLLARREYSQRELMERLHRRYREATAEALAEVVQQLADEGLQNDLRFAESYVRLRVSRGQGPAKIAWELQQRGIDAPTADSLLAAYDWRELADAALDKKYGRRQPQDLQDKARMARFLSQRGFDWDHL
ncbi:regulatory protein RecX [Natronospirillum operosum]|uniref:Regulatory protein RecX n=1 Tax=Natronospirillum operosum TaxID=2759953 RepID=A0A4Z0WAI7_9GAMM|nr:regulatory protein RecX [Natronospirillum operosum]TGG95152.1 regulatory protein RecX [Natronospirillum operosum]